MSKLALRKRRKNVALRHTIIINDYAGMLGAMTPAQRTAFVTRELRRYLRRVKK